MTMPARTYHIALATTLFGILVWGSVKLSGSYQSVLRVPVVPANMPPGLALAKPIPSVLEVAVRGEGWALAGYLWNRRLRFPIDLQTLASSPKTITLRDLQRELGMPAGIEMIRMDPDSVSVGLEAYGERKVPVLLHTRLHYADGYGISGAPLIVPESVTVGGAASFVDTLAAWTVSVPGKTELRTPLQWDIPLNDSSAYYVGLVPPDIHLTVNVQPLAEKTLPGIPVDVLSAPTDREVILIPPKIDVLVRGAIDQLASLTQEECHASVRYSEIASDTLRSVVPDVSVPRGLVVIGRTPEHLQFVIRKRLMSRGSGSQ